MSETPTWPLVLALEALFEGDVALNAMIHGQVYKTVAARSGESRERPYIVLPTTTERDKHQFAKLGSETSQDIHLVAGNNQQVVHTMYDHVKRLTRRPFALVDHTMIRVDVSLEMTFADENFEGERGIVRCAVVTVQS